MTRPPLTESQHPSHDLPELVDAFEKDLDEVIAQLEKAKGSSARWAQEARAWAGLTTAAIKATRHFTACTIANLGKFSAVFSAFYALGRDYLEHQGSQSISLTSLESAIEQYQALQKEAENIGKANKVIKNDPAALGLSQETLVNSLPNKPAEQVTIFAALKIQKILETHHVDLLRPSAAPAA